MSRGLEEYPLKLLGRKVAAVEDLVLSKSGRLVETKREMIFLPEVYAKKIRLSSYVWAGGLGVAAAAIAVLLILLTSSNLTATADGQSLSEGDFVSSNGAAEKQLAFSDGSIVRLAAQSGVRIRALHSRGAYMMLERGTFDIDIRHAGQTDWRFDVGPYCVFVTGTRFSLDWKPENETFQLDMKEGTVRVTGPMIANEKVVGKGERLQASLVLGRLTQLNGNTVSALSSTAVPAAVVPEPEPGPEVDAADADPP